MPGEQDVCIGGELKTLSCASTTDESNFELCQVDYEVTSDNIIMIYAINNSYCNHHEGLPGTYEEGEGVFGYLGNNIWVDDGCIVVIKICTGKAKFRLVLAPFLNLTALCFFYDLYDI